MKSTLGILGLILALFVGATPSHSRARGDDFTAVVKLIEQFYHVKHQSIPLMARAAMNAARTTARIKGGDAKHLAEAGSVRVVFFENQDFNSHGQIASFKAAMKTALDQQWSALVQTLLPKEEEQNYIYIRDADKKFQLLVVTIERREATVVQLTVAPDVLAELMKDPNGMGKTLTEDATLNDH